MPASDSVDRKITGNAKEVIAEAGKTAMDLAQCDGLEQATKQIVIPAVFGMIKIETKAEIGGK